MVCIVQIHISFLLLQEGVLLYCAVVFLLMREVIEDISGRTCEVPLSILYVALIRGIPRAVELF